MKIVLASANAGKLRELTTLLAPLGFELQAQTALGIEAPEETGRTFTDNALLKARYASGRASLPALADDSGIEVDALDGRPGVHSARYAGEHVTDLRNLEKLLSELAGIPVERRTARYRCVIAFVRSSDDPSPLIATGSWEGSILETPRGSGGFGYDPIFLPSGFTRSAGELSASEKNAVSHRAQALQTLVSSLARA